MATALPAPGSPQAPKYWRDEVSGALAAAVNQYLYYPDSMTLRDVALMRAYIRQWVDSPVWDMNPAHDTESRTALAHLRQTARWIVSPKDIRDWLRNALPVGIDPL